MELILYYFWVHPNFFQDTQRSQEYQSVLKNLMDIEFIISKLDFDVSMNKNELFGVCVNFCSIF